MGFIKLNTLLARDAQRTMSASTVMPPYLQRMYSEAIDMLQRVELRIALGILIALVTSLTSAMLDERKRRSVT